MGAADGNPFSGNLNDPTVPDFTADWESPVNIHVPSSFSSPLNPGTTVAGTPPTNDPTSDTAGELAYFNGSFVNNNNVVAMQGSGTADFPNLLLYVDLINADAVNVSFNARYRRLDRTTVRSNRSLFNIALATPEVSRTSAAVGFRMPPQAPAWPRSSRP